MNMILQDNSEETDYNIMEEQKKEEIKIIYWVNAPKIDSNLWIN